MQIKIINKKIIIIIIIIITIVLSFLKASITTKENKILLNIEENSAYQDLRIASNFTTLDTNPSDYDPKICNVLYNLAKKKDKKNDWFSHCEEYAIKIEHKESQNKNILYIGQDGNCAIFTFKKIKGIEYELLNYLFKNEKCGKYKLFPKEMKNEE